MHFRVINALFATHRLHSQSSEYIWAFGKRLFNLAKRGSSHPGHPAYIDWPNGGTEISIAQKFVSETHRQFRLSA